MLIEGAIFFEALLFLFYFLKKTFIPLPLAGYVMVIHLVGYLSSHIQRALAEKDVI